MIFCPEETPYSWGNGRIHQSGMDASAPFTRVVIFPLALDSSSPPGYFPAEDLASLSSQELDFSSSAPLHPSRRHDPGVSELAFSLKMRHNKCLVS